MTITSKHEFDSAPWKGPTKRYDIIKEGTIALVFVVVITILLSLFFPPSRKFAPLGMLLVTYYFSLKEQHVFGTCTG